MAIDRLDHFSIRTTKMQETRDFFVDVLGLEDGKRPAFDFPGHWLYCGERAVIHLIGHDPDNKALAHAVGEKSAEELVGSGSVDHVAFTISDAAGMAERFKKLNIPFKERDIADMNLKQIFVDDPNGVTIELNCFT